MPPNSSHSLPRLGFFGGSFDPMHQGHLSVALATIEKFSLQKVLLCPAFFAPLREKSPVFSADHRLAMVESVTKTHQALLSFDHEIRAEKTCFTYETLQMVQANYPKHKIHLMLGDDQFYKFDQWKFHRQILEEFSIIVFERNQVKKSQISKTQFLASAIHFLDNPIFPQSSTEIRDRIQQGLNISHLIPPPVLTYMKNNRLLDSDLL